jgi:hypothetical protein
MSATGGTDEPRTVDPGYLAGGSGEEPVLTGTVATPDYGLSFNPDDLHRQLRAFEEYFGDAYGSWGHLPRVRGKAGPAEREAWREAEAGTVPLRAAAAEHARRTPQVLRHREWRAITQLMARAARIARKAASGHTVPAAGMLDTWRRAWAGLRAAAVRTAVRVASVLPSAAVFSAGIGKAANRASATGSLIRPQAAGRRAGRGPVTGARDVIQSAGRRPRSPSR